MPNQPLLISADSHVIEPPEVFAPVARRFGRDEPKMVYTEERGWQLDTGLGRSISIGLFALAGLEPQSKEETDMERGGYDARPSILDIRARLEDMDTDGVDAEVLFPSSLSGFFAMDGADLEIAKATLASYNDWLANYVKDGEGRLFPLACIQTADVEGAIEEMVRAKKLGHVGIVAPYGLPLNRPYTDPTYDRFWAAAQDLSMPVTFHAAIGGPRDTMPEFFRRHRLNFVMLSLGISATIADLILSGVCERFPEIRFVPTEFETGWIAHYLQRMDSSQFRRGDRSALPMEFSDYWHRNFLTTFEDDELGIRTRDIIGTNTLMWASDYPHGASVWPHSRSTIEQITRGCTPEETALMAAGNAIKLFGLPFEV